MKLKNWLLTAGFLLPFVANAPALASSPAKPNDPVGNVIGNYCNNIIENSMKRFVVEDNREEKIKLVEELSRCVEIPETHEELENELIDKWGYFYRQNLLGKLTKPIRKAVDNGNKYDVIMYEPLTSAGTSLDNPNAFNLYGRIFIDDKKMKSLTNGVFELYKSKDVDFFPAKVNARFYESMKGKNDEETRQNIYNNLVESYVQHEIEHLRNEDKNMNVPGEVKAYVGSFVRAPSYNVIMDLDYFIQIKDSYYGKAAERIFDLFEVHGVPKEKIPDIPLEELKKTAEEIYKEL